MSGITIYNTIISGDSTFTSIFQLDTGNPMFVHLEKVRNLFGRQFFSQTG